MLNSKPQARAPTVGIVTYIPTGDNCGISCEMITIESEV